MAIRGRPAKALGAVMRARVQIPPTPPVCGLRPPGLHYRGVHMLAGHEPLKWNCAFLTESKAPAMKCLAGLASVKYGVILGFQCVTAGQLDFKSKEKHCHMLQ